jgi:multiple sugar transport system permease protein
MKGVAGMKMKRAAPAAAFHLTVVLFGLFMVYPLVWMISASFKEATAIFQDPGFLPNPFVVQNYIDGWRGISGIGFDRFFLNSLLLVFAAIVGNVSSCILAAFAFARLSFRLRPLWFTIVLGTMMLPLHVRLIPQYVVYQRLGWVNTYIPLALPTFLGVNGFFIFLLTQYMRGLPRELDEAATVDGCGPFRLFWNIIAPLSAPAVVTVCIFSFIWTWNDFFSQMIYLNDMNRYTVSLALRMYVDAIGNSSWGALFAMSTLSLVPLFAMFLAFQNYMVEGITAGSVKG